MRLLAAAHIGWTVVTVAVAEALVCGLAFLPVVFLWSYLARWAPAQTVPKLVAIAFAIVPSYVLFGLLLMPVSALAVRTLGWRTPTGLEVRIADVDWPLLRWVAWHGDGPHREARRRRRVPRLTRVDGISPARGRASGPAGLLTKSSRAQRRGRRLIADAFAADVAATLRGRVQSIGGGNPSLNRIRMWIARAVVIFIFAREVIRKWRLSKNDDGEMHL